MFASLLHCFVGLVAACRICSASSCSFGFVMGVSLAIFSAVASALLLVFTKISACFCCCRVSATRSVSGSLVVEGIESCLFTERNKQVILYECSACLSGA